MDIIGKKEKNALSNKYSPKRSTDIDAFIKKKREDKANAKKDKKIAKLEKAASKRTASKSAEKKSDNKKSGKAVK